MVLSCHNITKAFDDKTVLKSVSFNLEAMEKAAVVGANGAGKTTLLRIITGEIEADKGGAVFSRDVSFGYVKQNQDLSSDKTVFETLKEAKKDVIELEAEIRRAEELMKILSGNELLKLSDKYAEMTARFQRDGGYQWRGGIIGVARGLGFSEDELDRKLSCLSGGEKTRVAIGKLLLTKPDVIILDEPTNHLDIKSVQWLETYLRNYQGAVLIVSHDRYFLDRIVGKVIEIENTGSAVYNGNYSVYSEKKAADRAVRWHAYVNQQKEIKRQEEVIRKLKSFNREKSIKRAESREKMLDKVERLEKPSDINDEMRIVLSPNVESGKDVLEVEGLSMSFGERRLFKDISFEIKRGEKVAIVGDNGVGKSTLMKIIIGKIIKESGRIRFGTKVHVGYYDQEQQLLDDNKTLFDEISDAYPMLGNTLIRSHLAAFLFIGEDVYKQVKDLSGGERGKLCLAKLMLSEANFLLLDEPTNHLDITSREVLESAISGYEGTVLYVSHDRYFINRTATRVMDLVDEKLINYIGNYDYYIEHKPERMEHILHVGYDKDGSNTGKIMEKTIEPYVASLEKSGTAALDWKAQKELAAIKRKKESELKKCEEMIEILENKNKEINLQFFLPEVASNSAKLRQLTKEQEDINAKLEVLYEQWEELS